MEPIASTNAAKTNDGGTQIRVMVVDDSAVVRGLITRMFAGEPDIVVVESAANGQLAVDRLARQDVDVIILDIEMPVMDGLTALPKLLKINPTVKVIMASTLTLRNADISMSALRAGAADYQPKPSEPKDLGPTGEFRRELVEKVRAHGRARQRLGGAATAPNRAAALARPASMPAPPAKPIVLRKPGALRPQVMAVGSSTGGPQALFSFFSGLKGRVTLPIFITQHMPPTFTTILAEHLSKWSGLPCAEGRDGEAVVPQRMYLAPGGFHMVVAVEAGKKVIRLNEGPKENFCRPAVDPMLRSIVAAYGSSVLTVILTGMGADGLAGGKVVVDSGGTVVAQDEASSVVWGMPGAVATAGICSAVLPLAGLSEWVVKHVSGKPI